MDRSSRLNRTSGSRRPWLGVLLLLVAGCLSPTLPLPPPEEPDTISVSPEGTWEVSGSCIEGAEVVVLNEATGQGAVFVDLEHRGRYAVTLEGDPCDVIVISQSSGSEESGETRALLRPVEGGVEVDPAACE
ncbi:MAG: hypothetical protein IPG04_22010 [Polyangiaceae bacterium]|nr:hypothetical protein [Polyangiaceae bacterium]